MDVQEIFTALQPNPHTAKLPYDDVDSLINLCDIFSRANNISTYVIDYVQQEFLYVSPHPLFLSGYTQQEVREMGFHFYEKVTSPEDLQMLFEMRAMGVEFFHKTPVEKRSSLWRISSNFYLHHQKGGKILVLHKFIPMRFTPDGNLWMAVCFVSHSPYKESGYVTLIHEKQEYYKYDFENHKNVKYIPERLSEREVEILNLTMRGYEESQIAELLHVSPYTIKAHRRKIIKKLGVNNLSNAVAMFYSNI